MRFMRALANVKPRPAAIAVTAFALAACPLAVSEAGAESSGGVSNVSVTDAGDAEPAPRRKYDRLWARISTAERRWARRTSECESGGDPKAIGGGGLYRGAFQFMRSTWKRAPKSPGGDPIDHRYRTQAVVAIMLKRQAGTSPWPVCG